MKTDVRQKDGNYFLDIDLPGYKKEDIKISLENGTLTVAAVHNVNNEEKDHDGNIIRQERYSGSASRSWYVGTDVKQEDIHATFKDGILTVQIPDTEAQKKIESPHTISID
jgi:HSP20 family protein